MDIINKYYNFYINNKEIKEWKSTIGTYKLNEINDKTSDDYFLNKFLYDHSEYVTFDKMIKEIKNFLLKLNKNKEYYLYFPLHNKNYDLKIGSENIIVLECLDIIKKLNIKNIIFSPNDLININSNINLLILDDCIYTGKNHNHTIHIFNNHFIHYEFVLYAICDEGQYKLLNKYNNINFNFYSTPISLHEITYSKGNYSIDNYYKIKNILGIHKFYLIYFDHKIHDSYIPIYTKDIFINNIVPENKLSQILNNFIL